MIKEHFINNAKDVFKRLKLGVSADGKPIYLDQALDAIGIDVDEFCEKLADSDLKAGIDYLEFVLGEIRIDGEPCPEPRAMAIAIIAHLRGEDLEAESAQSSRRAERDVSNRTPAGDTQVDGPKESDIGAQEILRADLQKTAIAASVCLMTMDSYSALLFSIATFVLLRMKLI